MAMSQKTTENQYRPDWEEYYDKRWEKISRKLDRAAERLGGLTNNVGEATEEFFFDGLERRKRLDKMHFEKVVSKVKGVHGEYDIVMYNDKAIVIVEVKHKVHPQDLESVLKKKPRSFRKDFPQYKKTPIYGALAGFAVPDAVKKQAKEKGLFVLTRAGENIREWAPDRSGMTL